MNRGPAWWRELPRLERFRLASRVSIQSAVVIVAIAPRVGAIATIGRVVLGAAALVAVVALEWRPELSARTDERRANQVTVVAAVLLGAMCVGLAIDHLIGTADPDGWQAVNVGVVANLLVMASLTVLPFLPRRAVLVAVTASATGILFGDSVAMVVALTIVLAAVQAALIGTTWLASFGIQTLQDLERSRHYEADLKVAEERLRFARDLHDVVGRAFSAIAVKSELAAALSRAGDQRAATEMDEVKALAVSSLEETRAVVGGYRDIDLGSEIAGARSLLSAAGCRLAVVGDAAEVPGALHEAAAWVVREGTTNIVRHSSATAATLMLGPAGMSLRNDGVLAPPRAWSGLRGLSERLTAVGASMSHLVRDDEFILDIHWETA